METKKITGSEAFLRTLIAEGVDTIFGLLFQYMIACMISEIR